MSPLVDGTILVELARPAPSRGVLAWALLTPKLSLSVVTLEEFECALIRSAPANQVDPISRWLNEFLSDHCRLLEVTSAIARHAARLRALSSRNGLHMSPSDSIVAATAEQHDLLLVTQNPRLFAGCDLRIERPGNDTLLPPAP